MIIWIIIIIYTFASEVKESLKLNYYREAAMNQGLDVVMSEIHGMSQRGGSVSTELKIGGYNSSIIPKKEQTCCFHSNQLKPLEDWIK